MTSKLYRIELNGNFIGTTEFEFSDVPMGVVFGKINFENIESPYNLFKSFCLENNVEISDDDLEDKFLNTMIIPQLKVFYVDKNELKGWGAHIAGTDNEGFEIYYLGITEDIMKSEFKNHYEKYFNN